MTIENQRGWLPAKREPDGYFQHPDAIFRSTRSVAGTLRFGTAPGVGPGGPLLAGRSDMNMDRTSPRDFDPLGTVRDRSGEIKSGLISKQTRGSRNDKK